MHVALHMMAPNTASSSGASGTVALLALPSQSEVGVDGHNFVVRRDDFVGIHGVPSDYVFHLITVRAAGSTEAQSHSALTLGFAILPPRELDWIVVRRYDPQTEEVSSSPADDLTCSNIMQLIREGGVEPQRAIPYHRMLSLSQIDAWKKQTNFVSPRLLYMRSLSHGDKIVPGCYADDDDAPAPKPVDGEPVDYPPIPFLDYSNKLKRTRHVGTKRYLAQLSPSDRTSLFLDDHPADRVLTDILFRYYDNKWEDLLGDIQLSYTLLLHIHCLASLEHW